MGYERKLEKLEERKERIDTLIQRWKETRGGELSARVLGELARELREAEIPVRNLQMLDWILQEDYSDLLEKKGFSLRKTPRLEIDLESLRKAVEAWERRDFKKLGESLKDRLTRYLFWGLVFPGHFSSMQGLDIRQRDFPLPRIVYLEGKNGKFWVRLKPGWGRIPTLALEAQSMRGLMVYDPRTGKWWEMKGFHDLIPFLERRRERIHPATQTEMGRLVLDFGREEAKNLREMGIPAWALPIGKDVLFKEGEETKNVPGGQLIRGPGEVAPERFLRISAILANLVGWRNLTPKRAEVLGRIAAKAVKKVHSKGKSAVFKAPIIGWESAAHLGNIRLTGRLVDLENLEPLIFKYRLGDIARPILDLLGMKLSEEESKDMDLKRAFIRAYLKEYAGEEPPEDLVDALAHRRIESTIVGTSNYLRVREEVMKMLSAYLLSRLTGLDTL